MNSLRARWLLVLTLVGLALVGGCGGGGGGTPGGGGALSFLARWTPGTRSGPVGQSQRVRIFELNGVAYADQSLADSSVSSLTFETLPNRRLRVLAELFSGPNRSGTLTGTVETYINGGAASALTTVLRQQVVELVLHDGVSTLKSGETAKFSVTPRSDVGELVFVAPGDIVWTSTNPARATVSPEGLVTALAEGGVTITARHTASGTTISQAISITADAVSRSKWTVMVYMSAANNLYPFALQNMNQMERVAGNPANVRFVVQWKQVQGVGGNTSPLFSGTRRYLARSDSSSEIRSQLRQDLGNSVDMGDWRELRKFVQWAKASYPADRYALVLWGHGSGWAPGKFSPGARPRRIFDPKAIGFDDDSANVIDIWELSQAFAGERFDILASDACNMNMLEVAQEVQPFADYLIGSEDETPAPGYPYHRVFQPFRDNPDAPTRDLTEGFVTEWLDSYVGTAYDRLPLCQSVVDLSRLGPVTTALNGLSTEMLNRAATISSAVAGARANVRKYTSVIGEHQFYDLWDLSDELGNLEPGLATHTNALKDAITSAVVFNAQNATATTLGFRSRGIAIEFGRSGTFRLGDFQRLRLAPLTQWEELLSNPVANP